MPGMRPVSATPLHVRGQFQEAVPSPKHVSPWDHLLVDRRDTPQRAVGRVALADLQIASPPLSLSHDYAVGCGIGVGCAIIINPARGVPWPRPASRKNQTRCARFPGGSVRVPCSVTCRSENKAPPPMENRFGARARQREGGNAAGRSGISGSKGRGNWLVLIGQLARFNGGPGWLGPPGHHQSMCFRVADGFSPPRPSPRPSIETKPEFPHHPQLPRMSNTGLQPRRRLGESRWGVSRKALRNPLRNPLRNAPSPVSPLRILWPVGFLGAVGRPTGLLSGPVCPVKAKRSRLFAAGPGFGRNAASLLRPLVCLLGRASVSCL